MRRSSSTVELVAAEANIILFLFLILIIYSGISVSWTCRDICPK